MPSNDKPVNDHDGPPFFDQTAPPPALDLEEGHGTKRFARLRAGWDASWEEGGFLHERWEDVRHARFAGWHGMANWIKAVLSLAGVCAVIIVLDTAGDIVSAVAHQIATATPQTQAVAETANSFWAVIDHPVRSYIAQHSGAQLPVSGSAVYGFWHLVGLFGLVGGFFYSTGARLTWTVWGAASIGMVWSASPADSRTIATGIAALMWALASIFALRGLSLRPIVHIHPPVGQSEFGPELHFHAWIPAPAQPGDDTPGNVRQLQR